jgi:iron complex transport system substrate-binding protein
MKLGLKEKLMFNGSKKHILFVWIIWILVVGPGYAMGRQIVDMSGRTVTVPESITKVYGTSPPATYLIYAMDPELIAGLNFEFTTQERQFLDPRVKDISVIGGWFGQGRTPNQETLMKVKPDIMLAWMWGTTAANEKIEQLAKQLGFPVVYVRLDRLHDYAESFRFLGTLLNRESRGRMLSDYAEQALEAVGTAVSGLADEKKKRIYYAEGMDGLSTECDLSSHTELIPLAGAKNVYQCTPKDGFGMERISIEQVMLFDPAVILAQEKTFVEHVFQDPRWQGIRAVRDKHVLLIPRNPFNWFDRPPSFMRILGIQWLTHSLYPDRFSLDLPSETRKFYKLFLNVDLDYASFKKVLE